MIGAAIKVAKIATEPALRTLGHTPLKSERAATGWGRATGPQLAAQANATEIRPLAVLAIDAAGEAHLRSRAAVAVHPLMALQ